MAEGNGGWAEQECYASWSILGAWLCHVSNTDSSDSGQPLRPSPLLEVAPAHFPSSGKLPGRFEGRLAGIKSFVFLCVEHRFLLAQVADWILSGHQHR